PAAGDRGSTADAEHHAAGGSLDAIDRGGFLLDLELGEDLAILRRLHNVADLAAEIPRVSLVVGRDDHRALWVAADVPGRIHRRRQRGLAGARHDLDLEP